MSREELSVYFTSEEEKQLYERLVQDAKENKRSQFAPAVLLLERACQSEDEAQRRRS